MRRLAGLFKGKGKAEPESSRSVDYVAKWAALDDANGTRVTNLWELTDLWYRNLEEYAMDRSMFSTRTRSSGDKPFAVQFCSVESGWLPGFSAKQAGQLLAYFTRVNDSGSLVVSADEFYAMIATSDGRAAFVNDLERTLKLARVLAGQVVRPFAQFGAFMESRQYVEPAEEEKRGVPYNTAGGSSGAGGAGGAGRADNVEQRFSALDSTADEIQTSRGTLRGGGHGDSSASDGAAGGQDDADDDDGSDSSVAKEEEAASRRGE
jgi:hypothetical protein